MKEKNRVKETIEKAIKAMAGIGILLLLAGVANAEASISDGFDYPVGWPEHDNFSSYE